MTTLPSKYQIGDRVTHNDPSWSNPGVPARVTGVTIHEQGDPSYALRFDRESENGVIATFNIAEGNMAALVEQAA